MSIIVKQSVIADQRTREVIEIISSRMTALLIMIVSVVSLCIFYRNYYAFIIIICNVHNSTVLLQRVQKIFHQFVLICSSSSRRRQLNDLKMDSNDKLVEWWKFWDSSLWYVLISIPKVYQKITRILTNYSKFDKQTLCSVLRYYESTTGSVI